MNLSRRWAPSGHKVCPDNWWRACGRLSIHEGAIFFVFIPPGLAWGWFFLRYYLWLICPVVGTAITITALILAAWLTRRKSDVDSTHSENHRHSHRRLREKLAGQLRKLVMVLREALKITLSA